MHVCFLYNSGLWEIEGESEYQLGLWTQEATPVTLEYSMIQDNILYPAMCCVFLCFQTVGILVVKGS